MATFNEIYQSYLQNPYAGVNAIAPVQGIGSLQIQPGIGSLQIQPSVASTGDSTTTTTPTPTGVPSTFQPTMMDMVSLALNPMAGVANLASRTTTGLSLAERAMDAMGIGRGPGGRTEGYGVDSVNAQSVSEEGTVDANEGFGNQGGDSGSGPGGADAGTGPGGCSYATGGRVGFSNGSSGQDYWITVQEMYDNAGGEAGTGLGLIDFANKYFPKMANGGRVFYLQGGLASLLG
jgi:hypothetical protein